MKIIKSTEKKEERALVSFGEKIKEFPKKAGEYLNENRRRTIIICCSVLLIGAAVFVNWRLFGKKDADADYDAGEKAQSTTDTGSDTAPDDKNASAEVDNYFALAVISREKAHDESMETWQTLMNSTNITESEKEQAMANISKLASQIEIEANIEALVKGKGFSDCVAVLSDESVNVIVKCSQSLLPNELVQIQEIVCEQANVGIENVRIIEKMPI